MLFTLEPLQASEGDCLLLHWGTKAKPLLAVIDGGPGQTWETSLEPRLAAIRKKRKLAQLPIELVMVSHMDSDHIVGIKKAFRALKKAVEKKLPAKDRPYDYKRLWHNVFNDVLGDSVDAYYNTLNASLTASVGGAPNPAIVDALAAELEKQKLPADEAQATAYDMGLILAGHGEGRDLRVDHEFLHSANVTSVLNAPFKKNGKATLITADKTPKTTKISDLEIKILGPADAEIKALQTEFDAHIKKAGLTTASLIAAYADTSKKNLSSIVCLVTYKKKTILLTGDARGDKILAGLKAAKLLPLHVDVLKVPHHGSDRNATADFFEQVTADHYVFSGDGKHGNPERDTLKWVIDSRKKTDAYDLYLTYEISEIDPERKANHEEQRKKFPKKKLPPWDAKTMSLKSLFAGLKGYKLTLHEKAPFQIDLGDEALDV